MAERERKSKPRKPEAVEEEDEKHNWWHTAMWLAGAVWVLEIMYYVSTFLSGSSNKTPSWFYYVLLGTTAVVAAFWLAGWMADRKSAA